MKKKKPAKKVTLAQRFITATTGYFTLSQLRIMHIILEYLPVWAVERIITAIRNVHLAGLGDKPNFRGVGAGLADDLPCNYRVSWEIDNDDAANPVEAAEQAYADMHAEDSLATDFTVQDKAGKIYDVDLRFDDAVASCRDRATGRTTTHAI